MKFTLSIIWMLLLSSCAMVEIKTKPDPCSEQRQPSSQKKKCLALFEENNLQYYTERAKNNESGFSQTKFLSMDGKILKPGSERPTHSAKQIVSFFTATNSDATPNRGGVMIQGTPTELMFDQNGKPAFIKFAEQKIRILEYSPYFEGSPTKSIDGQGYKRHPEGFSTPMGVLKGWDKGLAEYSIHELKSLFEQYTDKNGITRLEFESGIVVEGRIENFIENRSGNYRSPTVITFVNCNVKLGDQFLYRAEWGPYDMILVTAITEDNVSVDSPTFNPDL